MAVAREALALARSNAATTSCRLPVFGSGVSWSCSTMRKAVSRPRPPALEPRAGSGMADGAIAELGNSGGHALGGVGPRRCSRRAIGSIGHAWATASRQARQAECAAGGERGHTESPFGALDRAAADPVVLQAPQARAQA